METIRLRNGAEEVKPLVVITIRTLEHVMDERPLAFYDLVMKCRDQNYQFFEDNEDYLKEQRLVDANGSIHDSIRNVVLSAAKGDGMDMVLRSPVSKIQEEGRA